MKEVFFDVVSLDAAKSLFNSGFTIHYEATDLDGQSRGSTANKETCPDFLKEIRAYLKAAVEDFGAKTMVFKVACDYTNSLHFEEIGSISKSFSQSGKNYNFVDLYMTKGDTTRFVIRYPETPAKKDKLYTQCKSLQYQATRLKDELVLSNGAYCKIAGPLGVLTPMQLISYANENQYKIDFEVTGVLFNDLKMFWDLKGKFVNDADRAFTYRIYDLKYAGEVARALRMNQDPMLFSKTA